MVNLCICLMQVHQSRFSLFFNLPHFRPQWLFPHACRFMCLCSCYKHRPLDPILRIIVVHGLLSLSQEGVHALVGAQEPVHAHNGLEGQDAAETEQRQDQTQDTPVPFTQSRRSNEGKLKLGDVQKDGRQLTFS